MPRRMSEVISTTKAFDSGNATPLEMAPRPYVITAMGLDFEINADTSASPGTTQDAYSRILSSLSLEGDGGSAFASMQDLRPLHFENKIFLPQPGRFIAQTVPGASQTGATRRAHFILHFGTRPVSPDGTWNPYDLTAGIPENQSTLNLVPTWAPATNMGSGWTVNAATKMRVHLYGVQAKPGEVVRPAAVPRFSGVKYTPDALTGSLGDAYKVPTSHFLHSTTILSLAGTAPADNRSRTALTDVGIELPSGGNSKIAKFDWDQFELLTGRSIGISEDDGTTFGTPTVEAQGDAGVGRLDMTTLGGMVNALYGLDLRAANPGDMVYLFGVGTVGTIYMLHRQYDII